MQKSLTTDYGFETKSLEKTGEFTGYGSIFHTADQQNDQIMPGAFHWTLKQWKAKNKLPFLLWQHTMQEPIGLWTRMQEDHRGLWVEGKLLLNIQRARDVYELMRSGVVQGLSIGYYPILSKKQGNVRKLLQIDLQEISLVLRPAHPEAVIS